VGGPVHVRLEGRDVVHEFYVPEFLFMRNALPGRPNEFTFTPTRIGTFRGQCAEFCGLHHAQMTFVLKVVSQADYVAWVDQACKAAQHVDCDPTGPLKLVSKDNSWNTGCLAVAAGGPFTVGVSNQDAGIEHNFAVYDKPDRKRTYFQGPRFAGVAEKTFQLRPLPKGRYYFQCDVHGPAMSGALIVK
jgi:plastocyanin